jgi:hypothetical protein
MLTASMATNSPDAGSVVSAELMSMAHFAF